MSGRIATEALARIAIVNPPFPVRLELGGLDCTLRITVTVPHRDTGATTEITHAFPLPVEWEYEDALIASQPGRVTSWTGPLAHVEPTRWIARRVQAVFSHEADECFHVDGQRAFDPHPHASPDATHDSQPLYRALRREANPFHVKASGG